MIEPGSPDDREPGSAGDPRTSGLNALVLCAAVCGAAWWLSNFVPWIPSLVAAGLCGAIAIRARGTDITVAGRIASALVGILYVWLRLHASWPELVGTPVSAVQAAHAWFASRTDAPPENPAAPPAAPPAPTEPAPPTSAAPLAPQPSPRATPAREPVHPAHASSSAGPPAHSAPPASSQPAHPSAGPARATPPPHAGSRERIAAADALPRARAIPPNALVAVLRITVAPQLRAAVQSDLLTDLVRGAVLKEAPGANVISKENILVLIGAQKTLADCEGSCEVDTGRKLGADFVITGSLEKLGTQSKLLLRLHATRTARELATSVQTVDRVENLAAIAERAVLELIAGRPAAPAR